LPFLVIFFLLTGFAQNCFAVDAVTIDSETVSGHISAANRFNWRDGYDIELRDKQIIIKVAVNLVPGNGVGELELDRIKPGWEKEIENTWSKQFAVQTTTGQHYPIIVDVTFKGIRFHHDVIIRPGGRCCSTELNWNIWDTPKAIAHEFGHMLGNYDEYRQGALDPVKNIIDPTSIMTSNPKHGMVYPRHFQRFLGWFKENNRSVNCMLVEY